MARSRLIFLFCIGAIFLFARASFSQRWGEWMFGDAQTMLAVENWRQDGFQRLNFLWVPQGYAKVTAHFDSEPLRHHAHGSWVGEGYRRIYTHYPSWYAVPYGLMGKVGIYHKTAYQFFAILLSLGSLIFLYLFVERLFDGRRAILTIGGYFFYLGFLEYCDSLSNIPYDDFFRFAFIWAWLEKRTRLAWLFYFFSCLTSLDSILYIYLFILLYKKPTGWVLLKFGMAPVIAIGICFLQNVGYLGLEGAILDWRAQQGAFGAAPTLWKHLTIVLEKSAGVLLLAPLFWFCDRMQTKRAWRLVLILTLAGMAYPLVFPTKVIALGYQLRQAAPALMLMWATIVQITWERRSIPLALTLLLATYFTHLQRLPRALDFPPQHRLAKADLDLFQKVTVSGDKVYFEYKSGLEKINNLNGYPQVHPLYEFYGRGPILGFPSVDALVRDLCLLEKKAPFTALVVTRDPVEFAGKLALEPVGGSGERRLFLARCPFATHAKFD